MKKQINIKLKVRKNDVASRGRNFVDNEAHFLAINQELNAIRSEMATKSELKKLRSEMATKMEGMEERIFRHFDLAVEQVETSLRGANSDHLSLLDDTKKDHEVRITNLEVRAGLRVD